MAKDIDARMELRVSPDEMTAYLDLYPAEGKGKPLTINVVEDYLDVYEVSWGIEEDVLKKSLWDLLDAKKPLKSVLIARGRPPVDSSPDYIKLRKRFYNPRSVMGIGRNGSIDHKKVSPYILVKKEEKIATYIASEEGIEGMTVSGKSIPFGAKKIEQLNPGKNIERKGDLFLSTCSGCFVREGLNFFVNEVLIVEGDVDYHTGHISFSNDIIINGTVKEGFRVLSGGSIHCRDTVDASEIYAKKDLVVGGGIIGKQKSIVRVNGNVETKFIEHCDVESLKGISVKKAIFKSDIYTRGSVFLDDKGFIIDSVVYAENGLTVGTVGRNGADHSILVAGVSFIYERKLDHLSRQHVRLELNLKKMRQMDQSPKRLALMDKIQKTMVKMQELMSAYLLKLYTNYDAEIVVTKKIYSGALIRIGEARFEVKFDLEKVKFVYDKEKKSIIKVSLPK